MRFDPISLAAYRHWLEIVRDDAFEIHPVHETWERGRMNSALRVLSPGLLTTIQDRGRIGYQHLGVPVSGALDPVALAAANALVNNRPDEAALEIFYRGPALAVEADSVRVAVAGGDALIERLEDR